MDVWPVLVIVLIAIGLAAAVSGTTTRCPSCKKWWARDLTDKEEVGRTNGYKTVIRHDINRDADGREIGRTERQEQVHVTRIEYRNHYRCGFCRHMWITFSTSEVGG